MQLNYYPVHNIICISDGADESDTPTLEEINVYFSSGWREIN